MFKGRQSLDFNDCFLCNSESMFSTLKRTIDNFGVPPSEILRRILLDSSTQTYYIMKKL